MIEQGFGREDAGILARYLYAENENIREGLVQAYYDTLVAQLRGTVSAAILDEARNLAEDAAVSLQRSFVELELQAIGETIAEGIAAGKHPSKIARELQAVNNLDPPRAAQLRKFAAQTPAPSQAEIDALHEKLLRDRRETIARTETAKAVSEGDALAAKSGGAVAKVWQSTGDARVSDECEANEAQGPIPVGDAFTSGAKVPPQHPNCRCAVSYIYNPEQLDNAKARSEQRAAATDAAKRLQEAVE